MLYPVIDRSIAPIHPGAPDFRFPEVQTTKLLSGVPIYCIPDHSQPLISVSLVFADGSFSEKTSGLSRFAMRMLTRGAGKYSASEFADELDIIGASLSSNAGWDCSEISLHVLSDYFEKALALMADATFRPIFDHDESALLRKQTVASIQHIFSDADQIAGIAAARAIFANTQYGKNRVGTFKSVQTFDEDSAASRYNEIFTSECFFIVAGNCSLDSAAQLLEKNFGELSYRSTKAAVYFPSITPERRVVVVNKPNTAQTSLRMGVTSVSHSHADYPAVELACAALGGFLTARLNRILREDKGYTYGAFSFHDAKKYAATLNAATSVNQDAAGESVGIILNELMVMQRDKLPSDELFRARQYLMGVFARNIETPLQVLHFVQTIKLFELDDSYYSDFFRKISSLTPDEIYAAQQRRFSPNNWSIVAVGNAESLAKQLLPFGEPEIIPISELNESDN